MTEAYSLALLAGPTRWPYSLALLAGPTRWPYSLAVLALTHAEPNRLVVQNPTGDVTVLGLRTMVARILLDEGHILSADVRATAQRIVAG